MINFDKIFNAVYEVTMYILFTAVGAGIVANQYNDIYHTIPSNVSTFIFILIGASCLFAPFGIYGIIRASKNNIDVKQEVRE
jgi:multisubunit Na+/H+ antiporter MnhG subunit